MLLGFHSDCYLVCRNELEKLLLNLHSLRIVHNDLKPDNIVHHVDRGFKLIDFGQAEKLEGGLASEEFG